MKKWLKQMITFVVVVCMVVSNMSIVSAETGVGGDDGGTGTQLVNVIVDGNGGTFSDGNGTVGNIGTDCPVGSTLAAEGLNITDPVYWDQARAFEGWEIYTWQTGTDSEGNNWEDWVALEGAELLATTELMAYVFPAETILFRAVWAGDDADYSSDVAFDPWGGIITVTTEYDTWDTDWYSNGCYERGTIQEELNLVSLSDPVMEGDSFEGWLMHFPETMEVEETLYTTAEVLAMQVPSENVVFWAKWASLPMESYVGGEGEGGEGDHVNVQIQGHGGTFTAVNETVEDIGLGLPMGSSLAAEGFSISDPVFWDSERVFEGWQVYLWQTVTDEAGNIWEEFVAQEEIGVLTTAQMLAYTIPECDVLLEAVWDGDDADYGSDVMLELWGGTTSIVNTWGDTEIIEGAHGTFGWGNSTVGESLHITSLAAPVLEGDTFEGWLMLNITAEGTVLATDSDGNALVYTTAEILAMDVPEDDVVFAAKWANVSVDEYLGGSSEGSWTYAEVNGNGGTVIIDGESTEGIAGDMIPETSLRAVGIEFTDPVYWDGEREFEGWMIQVIQEMTDEEGNTYMEWVQLEGSELITTEALLDYIIPESGIRFYAVWVGDDYDYGSDVSIDPMGGTFTVETLEGDALKVEGVTGFFWETGKIVDQMDITSMTDPVLDGDTFEGWLMFVEANEELIAVVDASGNVKLYTTDEILAMNVPVDNVVFVAKWANIPLEEYIGSESSGDDSSKEESSGDDSSKEESSGDDSSKEESSGDDSSKEESSGDDSSKEESSGDDSSKEESSDVDVSIEDLPVVDTSKPAEEVTVGVNASSAGEVLNDTANTIIDTVVKGNDGEVEDLEESVSSNVVKAIIAAVENGDDLKVATTVNVTPLEGDALEDAEIAQDVSAINSQAGNIEIVQFLDLTVEIRAYVNDELEETGKISQLEEPIIFTVAIPEDMAAVPEGYTRQYFIFYVHNGVVTRIEGTTNGENSVSFGAHQFSTYALGYEDKVIETPELPDGVPATGDTANVALYAGVMLAAVVVLVLAGTKKHSLSR